MTSTHVLCMPGCPCADTWEWSNSAELSPSSLEVMRQFIVCAAVRCATLVVFLVEPICWNYCFWWSVSRQPSSTPTSHYTSDVDIRRVFLCAQWLWPLLYNGFCRQLVEVSCDQLEANKFDAVRKRTDDIKASGILTVVHNNVLCDMSVRMVIYSTTAGRLVHIRSAAGNDDSKSTPIGTPHVITDTFSLTSPVLIDFFVREKPRSWFSLICFSHLFSQKMYSCRGYW